MSGLLQSRPRLTRQQKGVMSDDCLQKGERKTLSLAVGGWADVVYVRTYTPTKGCVSMEFDKLQSAGWV